MPRLLPALSAFLLAVAPTLGAPVPAEEKHVINLDYEPKVGQVTVETSYVKVVSTTAVTNADGGAVDNSKTTEVERVEFERTVLKVEGKTAVKFTRKYITATVEEDKGKRDRSYANRTLTFELKDGKCTITADDGKELDQQELDKLQKDAESRSDDKFIKLIDPAKAVKAGDTWQPNAKLIDQALNTDKGLQIDSDQSKVVVKLAKAYKQDKAQWGDIEATMELPIKSLEGATVLPGSTTTMKLGFNSPIDGSSPTGRMRMTLDFKIKATVGEGEQKVNIVSNTSMEAETTSTPKKK